MFQGQDGGYYLPAKAKCAKMACESGDVSPEQFDRNEDDYYKLMQCKCTKKGVCTLNFDNKAYTGNAQTDCAATYGGFRHFNEPKGKFYRWAAGRRSVATPEADVAGGPEYTLQNVCYDPWWYNML